MLAIQWIAVDAIKPNPGNARDDRIHVVRALLHRGARA
jgi:hypothetical protein